MTIAELNVQLRLLLDKVGLDARRASKVAKQAMLDEWKKSNPGGVAPGMEIFGLEQVQKTRTKIRRAAQMLTNTGAGLATSPPDLDAEMKAELMAAKKEKRRRKEADLSRMSDAIEADNLKRMMDRLKFFKDMSLLMLPLLKPGSPWATAFASRAISGGILGTETGRGFMAKFGLSGAGGAAKATTALIASAIAAGAALKALSFTVKDLTAKAIEYSKRVYAKSLESGLGSAFTIQRLNLANILGVSEQDVYKFGKAVEYLNPQLEFANRTFSSTNLKVAEIGIKLGVFKTDLTAVGAKLTSEAAPSINLFIDSLDKLIKKLAEVATKPIDALNKTTTDWEAASKKWEAAGKFAEKIKGLTITRDYEPGQSPFEQPKAYSFFLNGIKLEGKNLENIQKKFEGFFAGLPKEIQKGLPPPQTWMKQLPADTLGRMGLVMGAGINPAQQTAKNTHDMKQTLHKILNKIAAAGQSPEVFSPAQSYR